MTKVKQAPSLEELDQEIVVEPERKVHPILPSISLIGCGGCGINIVDSIAKTKLSVDGNLQFHAMDTSESNAMYLDDKVKCHLVAKTGSGKVRSTHVEDVQRNLGRNEYIKDPCDINVIIFGFSGGSGSVIGPLIARDFALKDKAVVIIGVVDDCSRLDCHNTINTFKTLDHMTKSDNLYFPIMLFDNIGHPRSAVDDSMRYRIVTLIEMMSSYHISEIDYTDKMNFLRPHNIGCAPSGVFLIGVTDSPSSSTLIIGEIGIELKAGEKVHAALAVNQDGKVGDVVSNVAYVGISSKVEYLSVIGIPIHKNVFDRLNQNQDKFNVLDNEPTTLGSRFKDQSVKEHSSKLIL